MGDAQVAATADAFSTYWNPAGLAAARRGLALSHRLWIGDARAYDFAAKLGKNWGLAVTATGVNDLEARESPGAPTGLFSTQFMSISAAHARALGPLRIGVALKYLRERIFESDASGYAIDAGVQLDLPRRLVTIGAAVRNNGRMSRLQNEKTTLPRTLAVGIALHPFRILAIDDGAPLLDLEVTLEGSHLFPDSATRLHLGAGVTIMDLATLRAGYISNDNLRATTYGLSLYWSELIFDYAYIPFKTGFEGPGHVLSLSYAW